jgi:hypothetical protein
MRRGMAGDHGSESGFAMLLVFVMAAAIAISLYYAMPRVAFESQRDKEQTLIDRGEQYKRAIQLYVRQNRRWPAKVEDLESTNGKRYLRRRYVDPMTGKDEWRPVHVGPNGVLMDSLVKPLKKDQQGDKYNNNFITELGPIGGAPEAPGGGNPGLRKRASDQSPTGAGDGSGNSAGGNIPPDPNATGNQPGQPQQASNNPPQNGLPGANPQQQGPQNLPPGMALPGQQQGFPGQQQPGQQQGFPGQQQPGQQQGFPGQPAGLPQQLQRVGSYPGPPVNSQTGGISVLGGVGGGQIPSGNSVSPGANGAAQPPMQGQLQGQIQGQPTGSNPQTGAPTNAAQLIQNILTSPRPGGAPGSANTAAGQGQVQGGGIAGFASKFEGQGIKVYNEQDEYQKWEFVYDMSKDAMITGGQNAIPQPAGPNTQPGQNGQSGQGTSGQTTSGFGNSSFGQTPTPAAPTAPTAPTVPRPNQD